MRRARGAAGVCAPSGAEAISSANTAKAATASRRVIVTREPHGKDPPILIAYQLTWIAEALAPAGGGGRAEALAIRWEGRLAIRCEDGSIHAGSQHGCAPFSHERAVAAAGFRP